jgi:hypothetical protein
MYVIYCLINESLKENIVNVGLADSVIELKQMVKKMNTAFLPAPYTIFLTKTVSNPNHIDTVYTLLCKFGKHLSGTFFEISLEFITQLFAIGGDAKSCDAKSCVAKSCDTKPRNTNIAKYSIVQSGTEYIIPMAITVENHYNHLKKNYTDLDL